MSDVTIQLRRIADLTPADWALWQEIQQGSSVYESPYFRPEFMRAVAAVRDDVEIAVLTKDGQTAGFFPFQRGSLGLGKPVGGKLSDYHGPLLRAGVELDPLALVRGCRLAAWDFDHLVPATPAMNTYVTSRGKSPQLNLGEGFESYARGRREAGSDEIHKNGQKSRKLAREVGPLDFHADADDEEAYGLLRTWKSAQYLRTGLADVFSFPWTIALLARLRELRGTEFSAPLTVLRAGGKVAAIALSLRSQGVLHAWFTAYNPELSKYSPGVTLFIRLAEEAQGLGIHQIDLGRGDERYKWSLASGSAEVAEGSISCPSLATWLRGRWRTTRAWVDQSSWKETVRYPAKLIQPLRNWLAYH
jgi:CelD/BcsL family acetyltransferase involved in cellulose biosynthesis